MSNPRLRWLRQRWKEFVGPEATATDTAVTLALGVLGGFGAPLATKAGRRTGKAEDLLLGVLAADLWGGVWANNTRACARWYERPAQTNGDHLAFAALHLHPIALAWMDRSEPRQVPGWAWASAHYAYLMLSTLTIRQAQRRRRVLGAALTAGGVWLDATLGPSPTAPWFGPVYYGKLLLGHAAAAMWPDSAIRPAPRQTP